MASKVARLGGHNLLTSDDPPKDVALKNPVAGTTGESSEHYLNILLNESTTDDLENDKVVFCSLLVCFLVVVFCLLLLLFVVGLFFVVVVVGVGGGWGVLFCVWGFHFVLFVCLFCSFVVFRFLFLDSEGWGWRWGRSFHCVSL